MGVKSTVCMSRSEAEKRYVWLALKVRGVFNSIRSEAVSMSDDQLEDILERMNDEVHGGEGFENYMIGDR